MGGKTRKSKRSGRGIVVATALLGALGITSVMLLVLSPTPLSPEVAANLFAVDASDSFESVFETKVPFQPTHWRAIYIHHSKMPSGDAVSLARSTGFLPDHFVIGNGSGLADGEVQIGQRWARQAAATNVDLEDCISICLIGDFDQSTPTAIQLQRLGELVQTLQGRCGIAGPEVHLNAHAVDATGIGRCFPAAVFRRQLLR